MAHPIRLSFIIEEEDYIQFKHYCITNKFSMTNFLKRAIKKVIKKN